MTTSSQTTAQAEGLGIPLKLSLIHILRVVISYFTTIVFMRRLCKLRRVTLVILCHLSLIHISVASIYKVDTEEEAIALANDSSYGLGGTVFSKNLDHAKDCLLYTSLARAR